MGSESYELFCLSGYGLDSTTAFDRIELRAECRKFDQLKAIQQE